MSFMKTPVPDNAMLVLALKSISDCVCISDMDDNIIFVNEAFLKTYGYSEVDLLGKPVSVVRSDRNCPRQISAILPETMKGGWRGELINRRKDGKEFPVTIATSVIYDDQGTPIALMGVAKDISETKRLQAKFRSVADLFQSLGPDTTKNINTIVTCASEVIGGAASLYNRLDESACSLVVWAGHNIPDDMNRADVPDGHICYEATIKGMDKPVVLGDLSTTSYVLSDPNVARFGLKSYIGAPVAVRGKTIGSLAVVDTIVREFTQDEIDLIWILSRALSYEEERQDAVAMLETAVQQSPSGILIADAPDVKIRIVNRKAMEILHGDDAKNVDYELHDKTWGWAASGPDGIPVPIDDLPLTRAIRTGEIIEEEELIIHASNGNEYYVSVNAAPVRNLEGTITSGVAIFHDITSKRKTELQLQQKVAELERFNSLMIGRELKMVELKKEINGLLINSGLEKKYRIHE
jgi:PAS domain S-box-containing protein